MARRDQSPYRYWSSFNPIFPAHQEPQPVNQNASENPFQNHGDSELDSVDYERMTSPELRTEEEHFRAQVARLSQQIDEGRQHVRDLAWAYSQNETPEPPTVVPHGMRQRPITTHEETRPYRGSRVHFQPGIFGAPLRMPTPQEYYRIDPLRTPFSGTTGAVSDHWEGTQDVRSHQAQHYPPSCTGNTGLTFVMTEPVMTTSAATLQGNRQNRDVESTPFRGRIWAPQTHSTPVSAWNSSAAVSSGHMINYAGNWMAPEPNTHPQGQPIHLGVLGTGWENMPISHAGQSRISGTYVGGQPIPSTGNQPALMQTHGAGSSPLYVPPQQTGLQSTPTGPTYQGGAYQHTTALPVPSGSMMAGCKPKKVSTYDGKSSWADYLVQFEIAAEVNNWTQRQKAMELATCLTGVARGILSDLDPKDRLDYEALKRKLTLRFEPEDLMGVYQSQLRIRRRKRNESIPELIQDISKLTRKAFPLADEETREYMSVSSFISALDNEQQELFVYQRDPKKLEEAGRAAMSYETFKLGRPRPDLQVRVQKVTNNSENQWTVGIVTKLEQVLGRLEKIEKVKDIPQQVKSVPGQTGSRGRNPNFPTGQKRGPCFLCKAEGHWKRDCPLRRSNSREEESSRNQSSTPAPLLTGREETVVASTQNSGNLN